MPDNQLVVGDRRFATIYRKTGIVWRFGKRSIYERC
jgi:hypothetical protein